MVTYIFFLLIILISSSLSVLDKSIGDACSETKDCLAAYSICDKHSKKCVCMNGFKKSSNASKCEPPKRSCPTWDGAPSSAANPPDCKWKFNQTLMKEIHTCKDTEFCFLHPSTISSDCFNIHVGHCCPKPPENATGLNVPCPLTVSTSRICIEHDFTDVQLPESEIGNCSFVTQKCVKVNDKYACCPLPCIGFASHFNSEGKCYDIAWIGKPCTITGQCFADGSFCKSSDKDKSNSTCQYKGKNHRDPTLSCEHNM